MSGLVNWLFFIFFIFILSALFHGDPDLWDKLIVIVNTWADSQLEQ